jgi:hypothetical protein
MTTDTKAEPALAHNLMVTAMALANEIFEEHVDGANDVYWDLMPLMTVEQGPNGPQPASRYVFLTYTRALVPPDGSSTISAFDVIPSPMLLLNGPFMRDLIVKSIAFVREQRRMQIAVPSPQ